METKEIKKLREMAGEIKVAMLTTLDQDGEMRSRPMATTKISEDGNAYFFTQADSPKIHELEADSKVNISYVDREEEIYVSVSGMASIERNQELINELWSPYLNAWFPEGKSDPNLTLLKVKISKAEYWDAPGNQMVQLLGMAKSILTKTPYGAGEHEKIDLTKKR